MIAASDSPQLVSKEQIKSSIVKRLEALVECEKGANSNGQQQQQQPMMLDSLELSRELEVDHETILSIYRSLEFKENYIESRMEKAVFYEFTNSGMTILNEGDPLYHLYHKLPSAGIEIERDTFLSENKQFDLKTVAKGLRCGDIKVSKANGVVLISKIGGRHTIDIMQKNLQEFKKSMDEGTIGDFPADTISLLIKEKMIIHKTCSRALFRPGSAFKDTSVSEKLELTATDLLNDEWQKFTFRKYNLNALGIPVSSGSLHPLLCMKDVISSALVQLGFNEMKTNQFVENSFWNFDSLCVQQNHPARDDQDTFFIDQCDKQNFIPQEIVDDVRKMHETMFGEAWDFNECTTKLLRTHTTAASSRTLYEKAIEFKERPEELQLKYFSIDKVFRNETLDSTHLAEFHQVEGWIAGKNLTLADLMGTLRQFYELVGIRRIKFKPTYNPYTEPSLEVFGYHEELGKWIEIANSGIFRPEMCTALGLDPSITVIAWGLSLERPTMIKYGINNIRDLYGHKVDLNMIQNSEICLL